MSGDSESAGETLEGRLLIAMPTMQDPRFERSVIFMCAHSSDGGAMGLIVNRKLPNLSFAELARQLEIEASPSGRAITMHFGGPVETGRGFVLHSTDYQRDATVRLGSGIALTATVDILRAMATGEGPEHAILALGYAGWAPGQLETEIQRNDWLHCDADDEVVFDKPLADKWAAAIARIGFDPALLSTTAGRA